jgi:hypothetical protein
MLRRGCSFGLGLGLLLVAGAAGAQESHKFDAKKLEAAYNLPVYAPKGAVVGNEVIEDTNDVQHSKNAIYEVKGDIKKALDFFTKALGEPKQKKSDTGITTYTYEKKVVDEPLIVRKIQVHIDPDSRQVQVVLKMRTFASRDDVIDE